MKPFCFYFLLFLAGFTSIAPDLAHADSYSYAIDVFKQSDAVKPFFENAYGYAIFPTIGKAGIGVGGAYGSGKVYQGGQLTGTSSVIKLSVGWQLGGQTFSEIIFFQDKRAYDEFTKGEFAFGAQASAVAITAGVQAQGGTSGVSASATAGPKTGAQAQTNYNKGMAVFVHAKGGLMYEAAIGGQKFNFKPSDEQTQEK
jgi:lipid-binding SYLF domain-containing protein